MTTKFSSRRAGKRRFGSVLAAALTLLLLTGCAQDDPSPADAPPQTETAGESAEGGWSPAKATPAGRKREIQSEAPAVGTLEQDSEDEAFGSVSHLMVYAADNEGIPYDIEAERDSVDKIFRLFLPCTADLTNLKVRAIHADGTQTGVYTMDFVNDLYIVKCSNGGAWYEVTAMQSKIPTVFLEIDESEGRISRMNADSSHTTRCWGDMTVVVTDELAEERGWKTECVSRENDPEKPGTMSMRGRGNWTWQQEKRPYQINLEKGEDLLGMGKDKTWLLLANVMDASLLRNQLFYDLAGEMGLAYSPEIEPVDVFLNGEYIGSYSLTEKVEIGESRVDIDEEQDFLLELDHYYMNETYTFTTNKGKNFTLHSPETNDAVKQLKRIVNRIEEKVYDEDSDDYLEDIDLDSWVRYWWVQDLSRNNDTFIGSNFFYYDFDAETLYAGPLWDMDNTLGIWGGGENLQTSGWHSANRGWLKHLYNHDSFREALEAYYWDELVEIFYELPDKIDEYAAYIRESAEMNYMVNDRIDYVNSRTKSWDEDVEYLKNFLNKRLDWYWKQLG